MLKSKLHNEFVMLDFIMKSEKFKALFIVTIIFCMYGGLTLTNIDTDLYNSFLQAFTYPIYNICIFALLIINIFHFITFFDKEFDYYFIRLKTKKNYIKSKMKFLLMYHTIYFIIILFLFISFLLIVKFINIRTTFYYYGMPTAIYLIWYMFRYYIISLLFSYIYMFVYEKWGKIISLFISMLFLIGIFVSTIINVNCPPWIFLIGHEYSSFLTEVCVSFGFIIILELIIYIFYSIYVRKKNI